MEEPTDILMNLPQSGTRSISPMSNPSPSRELRGIRLFRAISRKLGRRSTDDLSYAGEDDSRSSSTSSCSSTSAGARRRTKKANKGGSSCSSGGSGFRSASPNHNSSSGSESGSDAQQKRHRHHHSTGASFRKVFQNLTLNTSPRSQSCSNETKRRSTKKSTPKRILRPPVTYTYVRGISGLPTQRIPRNPPCSYVSQSICGCSGPFR